MADKEKFHWPTTVPPSTSEEILVDRLIEAISGLSAQLCEINQRQTNVTNVLDRIANVIDGQLGALVETIEQQRTLRLAELYSVSLDNKKTPWGVNPGFVTEVFQIRSGPQAGVIGVSTKNDREGEYTTVSGSFRDVMDRLAGKATPVAQPSTERLLERERNSAIEHVWHAVHDCATIEEALKKIQTLKRHDASDCEEDAATDSKSTRPVNDEDIKFAIWDVLGAYKTFKEKMISEDDFREAVARDIRNRFTGKRVQL